jgi:hypothetical protein
MAEADRLRAAGDPWGALERYQAADQIMRVPTTGLELARMHAAMVQLVEARAAALDAANMPVEKGESAAYARARAEAAQLAVQLAPRVPDVTVFVEPEGIESRISIDGAPLPRLPRPLPFRINPGTHMLVAEAPGYTIASQQFSLEEGEHARLRIVLLPEPANVQVAASERLPAQPHATGVESAAKSTPPGRTRGYAGVIAGGAVMAAGVVMGLVATSQASAVREGCLGTRCPTSRRDDYDSAVTLANATNVSLAVGLAGMTYGLIELWLSGAFSSSERAAREPKALRLSVGVTQPGVQIEGTL